MDTSASTMKKGIVIIRGNPENHDKSRMEQYIQENQIEVLGDWFYDYRSDDSDWAFERYEDRLVCLKGVERNINLKGKISGRKSYLEKDPELVRRVRKLRMSNILILKSQRSYLIWDTRLRRVNHLDVE